MIGDVDGDAYNDLCPVGLCLYCFFSRLVVPILHLNSSRTYSLCMSFGKGCAWNSSRTYSLCMLELGLCADLT